MEPVNNNVINNQSNVANNRLAKVCVHFMTDVLQDKSSTTKKNCSNIYSAAQYQSEITAEQQAAKDLDNRNCPPPICD